MVIKCNVLFSLYWVFFYGSASITGGIETLRVLCAAINKAFWKHGRILTVKHCSRRKQGEYSLDGCSTIKFYLIFAYGWDFHFLWGLCHWHLGDLVGWVFFPQWVPCSLSLLLCHGLLSQSCWESSCALEQEEPEQTNAFLISDSK